MSDVLVVNDMIFSKRVHKAELRHFFWSGPTLRAAGIPLIPPCPRRAAEGAQFRTF
jgi:hypothetical protein